MKSTTPSAIAKKAGLEKSYVGRILSGDIKRPGPSNLRKLERALSLKTGHFKYPARPRASPDVLLEQILDRLRSLEESVDAAAQDTAESLARLAAAIDGLSSEQPGAARGARRR